MKIRLMLNKIGLLLLFSVNLAWAQKIDYNKIILPRSSEQISFEERLVQLAWQNSPKNEIARRDVEISYTEFTLEKWSWLNKITASGNLNEFTIDPGANEDAQFFPRYNFSINVPLGIFLDQASETRIARQRIYVEQQKLNQQKLEVRTEVLKRYENFLRDQQVSDLLTEILAEVKTMYDKIDQDILDGIRPIDDRFAISERLKKANIDKIRADADTRISKLEIEEMIGIPLEEVLN